jgi:predicted AAA+ superfamily ATPase
MFYIKRAIEEYLMKSSETFKSILVTGPRQVGKTTLLKQSYSNIKYITLDDPFMEEQAKENGGMFLMINKPPLIIDEVQYAPELFRYIKIKCDESDNKGQFLLTGSQQFQLMRNVSETLSGRINVLELSGLSLREIQNDIFNEPFIPSIEYINRRESTLKKVDNIWDIIHRGSYPDLQDKNIDWSSFYSSYIKTYIERDVRNLTAVQNEDDFRKFMISVAARTGEVLNYSNIASEIGRDPNTIKNWISILEASGIIYLLEPYASTTFKKAIKTPKLYFRDTGLVCYLTRWLTAESAAFGAMSGHIFETFVISEILKSFSNRGLDYRFFLSYYRGRDKVKTEVCGEKTEIEGEIDLIIEENGILYPIEIKMNSNPKVNRTSTFMVLDKIKNKKRGMGSIICMCSEPGILRENVIALPVWYI